MEQTDTVSYTHLDVYKRQALWVWQSATAFCMPVMTFIREEAFFIAALIAPAFSFTHCRAVSKSSRVNSSCSVSYTHLDVYKRQAQSSMWIWEPKRRYNSS